MTPQRGPRSQCACGAKANARLAPSSRTVRFSLSSFPTGTEGCGRLGNSRSLSSRDASRADRSLRSCSFFSLRAAPLALISSRAAGVGALAISRDKRFWSAWMAWESFLSLRTSSSRAITASRSTSAPSLRSPARTSSGVSRMRRMSSMEVPECTTTPGPAASACLSYQGIGTR